LNRQKPIARSVSACAPAAQGPAVGDLSATGVAQLDHAAGRDPCRFAQAAEVTVSVKRTAPKADASTSAISWPYARAQLLVGRRAGEARRAPARGDAPAPRNRRPLGCPARIVREHAGSLT
jgi:hypothetical protein